LFRHQQGSGQNVWAGRWLFEKLQHDPKQQHSVAIRDQRNVLFSLANSSE